MLGLELRDSVAVAVAVDDAGVVRARAEASSAPEPTAAAFEALDRVVASTGGADGGLGVSAIAPESPATAAVLAALGRRYAGAFVHEGATASGTAAAIAEAWTGAARNARDVVFFSVADHTTAGIVRDGVAVRGAHRRAPAVAWLSLNPVEREDYRKTGCLEAEVAGAGIVRRLIWRIKAGDHSRVQEMVNGDLSAITVEHLLEAARQNDGVSFSVVRDTAKYLGMAASNLVAVTDPEVLVVGGIMASAADLFLEPLRVEIGRRLPPVMMEALTIAPAALGADAAAIGAARLGATALR
ncbi:MAG: ROK family protein [Acidobacteria bacterium]|nr:ROK family protein [Acidobacteriota bacterium]